MPCLCQQYYALATICGGDGDVVGIVIDAAFVLQHQTMHIIRLLIKFIDSTSSFIRIRINSSRKGATLHILYVYMYMYMCAHEVFNVHLRRAAEGGGEKVKKVDRNFMFRLQVVLNEAVWYEYLVHIEWMAFERALATMNFGSINPANAMHNIAHSIEVV